MARRSALSLGLVAVLSASCADSVGETPTAVSSEGAFGVPGSTTPSTGEYLVGLDAGASLPAEAIAASGAAASVTDQVPALNVVAVGGVTNPEALRVSGVRYIEAQGVFTLDHQRGPSEGALSGGAAGVPGTAATYYMRGRLWGMKTIKVDGLWAPTNAGAGAIACVVDTGVDGTHQDLTGQLIGATEFITTGSATDQTSVLDLNGHGTHVAGTIAGKGGVITGVAPAAKLLSARVLNAAGSGQVSWIANGITWCADNGAHVINMSLGGLRFIGSASYASSLATYGAAIAYANALGTVVVVSAGNSNVKLPNPMIAFHPAQVPGTIIVGATGPLSKSGVGNGTGTTAATIYDPFDPTRIWRPVDNKAYYSNFGTAVMVFAPGGRGSVPFSEPYRLVSGVAQGVSSDNIWSACATTGGTCVGLANNFYISFAGTSMAAPHVAGLATFLYAEPPLGAARNAVNQLRVKNCILNNTDNIGPSTTYGGGRINALKAHAALMSSTC